MHTADPVASSIPVPSHLLKVVDSSPVVNRKSHSGTALSHGSVISSRSARGHSTGAVEALRECHGLQFQVTGGDEPFCFSQAKEVRHVPVSRAGCTVNEGYQISETYRLCRGLESPRVAQEVARGTPYAVTLANGELAMVPPPPAMPLSHPFINTRLIEGVYQPEGTLQ